MLLFGGIHTHTKSNMEANRGNLKKNAVWFWWVNSVPDGESRTKIGHATSEKRWRVCTHTRTCALYACRSPAISPRVLNGSQPNLPGRRHMGWNRKRVVQTSEICRGVRLEAKMSIFARPSHTTCNVAGKACPRLQVRRKIKLLYTYILAKMHASSGLVTLSELRLSLDSQHCHPGEWQLLDRLVKLC